jgi:hypothetical protein
LWAAFPEAVVDLQIPSLQVAELAEALPKRVEYACRGARGVSCQVPDAVDLCWMLGRLLRLCGERRNETTGPARSAGSGGGPRRNGGTSDLVRSRGVRSPCTSRRRQGAK